MAKGARVLLPAEHGSWSLMLTPFLIGAGVAWVAGHETSGLALTLALVAVLALFLARQPLATWLRARTRAPEAAAEAFRWGLAMLVVAALTGLGLLALGRGVVLWLALPAAMLLAVTLAMSSWLGPRRLATELAGVAGLALAAPAAYVAGTGALDATAAGVWAISALYSGLSVVYVRLRLHQRNERVSRGEGIWVVVAHLLGGAAVLAGIRAGWLPALLALPFGLMAARAAVAAWRNPPLESVRRFGFTEMALALCFAALAIFAYAREY
ncbi:MAG: hypothetical protein GX785_18340 [Armatimonadetes bacterium]|nr:hypothetical protein [Armatimonadota bacterium]